MATARGRGIEAQLPLDTASGTEPESADVAGEVERVGARGGKEVFTTVGEEDDIGSIAFGWEA